MNTDFVANTAIGVLPNALLIPVSPTLAGVMATFGFGLAVVKHYSSRKENK